MAKLKSVQRIKESIGEVEYKKLISQIRGDEDLREYSRERFLKAFTLLYYTGLRVNELLQLKNSDILKALENKEIVIFTQKTNKERKLYFSEQSVKDILKVFPSLHDEPENYFVIRKHNAPTINLHPISFISAINAKIKEILGERYTSHSFRQGLITEMSAKGINPKIVQEFIGHSDMKTTLGYYKPSQNDVKNAMTR